jgi:integrase/recombinase XerD
MSKLRGDFIVHLQLRGFSQATIDNYVDGVSQLARYYNKSPLELSPEQIKDYLIHLRNERKFAVRTLNLHMYSIRSFYKHFMPDKNMMGDTRRMKEPEHHPEILSKQEVLAMIDSEPNTKKRTIIALMYSSGIRLKECTSLKISDIDSR